MSRSSVPPSVALSSSTKISALESTLQQSLTYCQDLTREFENLCIECKENKNQLITQKEKCESKLCRSSEELLKAIETKNNMLQLVASTLIKLYETKNFNILNDAFVILRGEKLIDLPNLEPALLEDECKNIKKESLTPKKQFFTPKKELFSPKKEVFTPILDSSLKEESVSEIDGTPTGRTSPIIQSRKLRSLLSSNQTEIGDKKKCPSNWATSEKKAIKLSIPIPKAQSKRGSNIRLRQGRLDWAKVKPSNVVDLTSSPELMSMDRNLQNSDNIQPLVKKESTDNDDTILPSPTSGPNNFSSVCKATSMISPIKFKKPSLCLKNKNNEVQTPTAALCDLENTSNKDSSTGVNNQAEDSINLLKPVRSLIKSDENSPLKIMPVDDDETHCEIPSSLSILDAVNVLEQQQDQSNSQKATSPSKMPLGENRNITNVPKEADSSMSLLGPVKVSPTDEKIKRSLSCKRPTVPAEPLYKEQLPRTKTEKRKLPGWNCDECRQFYDELYANDSEMLAEKMKQCSKHRGRNNPARPKTPEGFWNPRWSVPQDTEEFNKRNNVS